MDELQEILLKQVKGKRLSWKRLVRFVITVAVVAWAVNYYKGGPPICTDPYHSEIISMEQFHGVKRSLTVVTAYFNIGDIPEGWEHHAMSHATFSKLAPNFRYLQNPLIFFTDDVDAANEIWEFRKAKRGLTKIHLISRNSLWVWDDIDVIREQSGARSVPEYLCLLHAKIPLLDRAAQWNVFKTDYLAWMDIAVNEQFPRNLKPFWIEVPEPTDKAIGMSKAKLNPHLRSVSQKANVSVLSTSVFYGNEAAIAKLHRNFRYSYLNLLDQGMILTDEHTVWAMYNSGDILESDKVEMKLYDRDSEHEDWNLLALMMYREEESYRSGLDYKKMEDDDDDDDGDDGDDL